MKRPAGASCARFSKLTRRRGEGLRRNPPAKAPRIALFWPAAPGATCAPREGGRRACRCPRGAPRGQRQARRPPSRGAHVAPGAAGQNKAIRGAFAGGFRLSPSPRLRVNLLNRAQLAPAGRFINRPVYCDDSRISDHTPTFAKRAGILPAVLRATNSVCSATPNPT